MKLNLLPKITAKKKKRIGHGYGSGVGGHTSTRGQKGQKARSNMPVWFEGGQLPQIRRFPFIKGKNRFKSLNPETITITLTKLSKLKANTVVDFKTLVEASIISSKDLKRYSFKIVANGSIDIPLTISIPLSKAAQAKIEAAGGKISREQAV